MKRSLWMVGGTLGILAVLLLIPAMTMSSLPTESPARVTVAQVSIGDVEQVLALTGRVRYASEYTALTPFAGIVRQICVKPGQRIQKGQILFRLDATVQENVVSRILALPDAPSFYQDISQAAALLDAAVVRAPSDGYVHLIHIDTNGGVTAGLPAMLLSSGEQQVVCPAVMTEASRVKKGMSARLYIQEDLLCTGRIVDIGALETDPSTGQTVANITLVPNQPLSLPMGAALDAEIILKRQINVPVIPVEALSENETVWWIADGRCYETDAGVVLTDEMSAWVALPEGVSVVLSGQVVEGQRVKEVPK